MIPDPNYPSPWTTEKKWLPISVVIPAHNEAKYLPDTLAALKRVTAKIGVVAQIIVVNDASTDRTAELAREQGVQVVDVELRNIGAVRNAGAEMAVHERLFFLDADTELPEKTLIDAMKALDKGAAGGGAHVTIPDAETIPFLKRMMFYGMRTVWQVIGRWAAGCFMFCRTDDFRDFGGFDETFFAAEELFFSNEVRKRGLFRLVRHPVVTSSRKLHAYSTVELVRFLLLPLTNLKGPLKSKVGLEILYEDAR